jgi:hypothetical protein
LLIFLVVSVIIITFAKKIKIILIMEQEKKYFDGRELDYLTHVDYKTIKVGDVVLEGDDLDKNPQYCTLTQVRGNYWEYFKDGFYHSTSPAYCHWLVNGQKHCDGKLLKIDYYSSQCE